MAQRLERQNKLGEEILRKREADVDPADMQAWTNACKIHSYTAYESYARLFPQGKYRDLAIQRYRKLKPFWKKEESFT